MNLKSKLFKKLFSHNYLIIIFTLLFSFRAQAASNYKCDDDKTTILIKKRIEFARKVSSHPNTRELIKLMKLIDDRVSMDKLKIIRNEYKNPTSDNSKANSETSIPQSIKEPEALSPKAITFNEYRSAMQSLEDEPGIDLIILRDELRDKHLGINIFGYKIKYKGKAYYFSSHIGSSSLNLIGTDEQVAEFDSLFKELQNLDTKKIEQSKKLRKSSNKKSTTYIQDPRERRLENATINQKIKEIEAEQESLKIQLQKIKKFSIKYDNKNIDVDNQKIKLYSEVTEDHYSTGFYGVGLRNFMPARGFYGSDPCTERQVDPGEQEKIDGVNHIQRRKSVQYQQNNSQQSR